MKRSVFRSVFFPSVIIFVGKSTDSVEELRNVFLESKRSIRTDFAAGTDCYQKAVRFCYDGSRLVTGGVEGVVRVWKVCVCV